MNHTLPEMLVARHTINQYQPPGYDIHCHSFYELYFFISGKISYHVEGRQYTPLPQSILLMAPNVLHGMKYLENSTYERYVLHFTAQSLPPETRSFLLAPFHCRENLYYTEAEEFSFQEHFESLLACQNLSSDIRRPAERIALQSLLLLLVRMSLRSQPPQPEEKLSPIISQVLAYLNENLSEELRLDDLATRFFISKDHLNRLFHLATGTTIRQYVLYKRISFAQQRILAGEPAASAAMAAGFRDYSVFFRTYKKILGHSPSADKIRLGGISKPEN